MKGEFKKRARWEDSWESYVVYMKDIDEAREAFPQHKTWQTPSEELECWRKVSLSSQSRAVASWIKSRIETLEWLIEWFGDEGGEKE